ncbi:MAG: phospholipase [Gemmatimonadaceae bacterium]|nr:phospholipase [Gemmatimonadaceae bacterium]
MMREHHLPVSRTARYYALGDPRGPLREVWFVCHGYGQLAARFLRHFETLDTGDRLIIAPEALSRFYIEPASGGTHAHAAVGASWMTREDRLSEIDDYIRYLDALYAQVFQEVPRDAVRVVVLGFSQGVATVSRWLARGTSRADRLVLWGSVLPHDLDLETNGAALRRLELVVVAGEHDELTTPAMLAEQAERLARSEIAHRLVRYAGGHRIERDTLAALAAEHGA